jgi:hypothetical protein
MIYLYRPLKPESFPENIEQRAPEILASWRAQFPDSVPAARDEEDWIENAVILHEAAKAGIEIQIIQNTRHVHISSMGGGWMTPKENPDAPNGVMLGMWMNEDFLMGLPVKINSIGSDKRSVEAAGKYYLSDTFLKYAGRKIEVSAGNDENLESAIRSVIKPGDTKVFMKTIAKGWARVFEFKADSANIWKAIVKKDTELGDNGEDSYGLSWIPVEYEENERAAFMLQEAMSPTFEYRMFIVNGVPVTGAGCVEKFTPAENIEVFDAQMEEFRSKSDVVVNTALRDAYLEYAKAFCADFAAEHGEGLDYSLDLCVNADTGKITVVELNPPLNLGRYASDVGSWLAAHIERAENF